MADIATLGFRADTADLSRAKSELEALPQAAGKAEASSNRLSGTLDKVNAAADKLSAAAVGLSSAVDKMAGYMERGTNATKMADAAAGKMTATVTTMSVVFNSTVTAAVGVTNAMEKQSVAAVATGQSFSQLDAHVDAYRASLRQSTIDQMQAAAGMEQLDAHVKAYRASLAGAVSTGQQYDAHVQAFHAANGRVKDGLDDVTKSIKFTAAEGLNFSRQLADIGVTAAMGMSPLMIALQQGPQLFDIIQQKAVTSGTTIKAVFAEAGVVIWTALAPLLPLIAGIAIAVGAVVGAFALGARQINKDVGDVTAGMGLTEKQLERVKKKGVETTVTLGDTFTAFFQVTGERLASAFEGPLNAISKATTDAFNWMTTMAARAARDIIGTFTGSYYAIVALWKNMPGTFKGIAALIGNAFIATFEAMINDVIDTINSLNGLINKGLKAAGLDFQFMIYDKVKLNRIADTQAEAAADAISKGYDQGYKKGVAATDRFFKDVEARAKKNRQELVKIAAGDPEAGDKPKKPRTPKQKRSALDDYIPRDRPDPFADAADPEFLTRNIKMREVEPNFDALTAAIEKYKRGIDGIKEVTKGFFADLQQGLKNGEGLWKSFGNAALSTLNNIFNRLLDKTLNMAFDALFSSGKGQGIAALFSANGNVFSGNGVHAFASGAAFTNSIVDKPTAFAFGKGGANLGIMGEAGPEAIMPLRRGADGSLGVQMHGDAPSGTMISAPVSVTNHYTIAGAIDRAEIVDAIRQAGDQQTERTKRSFSGWLQSLQRDGTIV